jgi:hypothetical protein
VVMELDQVLAFFTESLGGKKVNRPGFRSPPDLEGFLSGPTGDGPTMEFPGNSLTLGHLVWAPDGNPSESRASKRLGAVQLVQTAQDAAQALAPLAGPFASYLFAVGLFGASVLSAAVVPLATTYSITEALGFERGVSFRFMEAPVFLGLFRDCWSSGRWWPWCRGSTSSSCSS